MTDNPFGTPVISVVMPVRNAASTLAAQLQALASQNFELPWELVVSDNGSTDHSPEIVRGWAARFPALRLVDASKFRGPAYARNVGVRAAAADLILFCDADDVVSPSWLTAMARGLAAHEVVTGPLEFQSLSSPRLSASMPATLRQARRAFGFKPFGPGGNLGVRRSIFDVVGCFDTSLQRGEDVDLSWRAQERGHEIHFEAGAVVYVRRRQDRQGAFDEGLRDGLDQVRLFRRWASAGMQREPVPSVVRAYLRLLKSSPRALRGGRHPWWFYDAGTRIGRALASLRGGPFYL